MSYKKEYVRKCAGIDKEMVIKPRGRIKIVSEMVFIKGEPHYKVLHIEAAYSRDLPDTYINGCPSCWCTDEIYDGPGYEEVRRVKILNIMCRDKDEGLMSCSLREGGVYTVQKYNMMIAFVEEAGKRLSTLLEQWRNMCFKDGNNVWKGTRVDVI